MLDFVDDLKSKGEVANARTAYVAAQTIATEQIALGKTDSEIIAAITNKKVSALTGITDYMDIVTTPPVVINGKVKKVTYVGATHTVVIENGKSAVVSKNS